MSETLEALRAKLAPEWWREDEKAWYVTCSVCDATGPRDDFWHFEDCVLGAAINRASQQAQQIAALTEALAEAVRFIEDDWFDNDEQSEFLVCARALLAAAAAAEPPRGEP